MCVCVCVCMCVCVSACVQNTNETIAVKKFKESEGTVKDAVSAVSAVHQCVTLLLPHR